MSQTVNQVHTGNFLLDNLIPRGTCSIEKTKKSTINRTHFNL
ncbi:hypothetical protein OAL24_01453 [Oenococcus sicerae]|nr:hypothetical protein OAL24_01453 [Oenococcus sicerae]